MMVTSMIKRSQFMLACLGLFFALPLFAQLQEPSPPVNLIIDSDMAVDADDVGDHAVMWALANRGEVKVLA
ncbi:MAG: nucleoside hydrolase, partial [Acidobacteria bacterium]